MGLKARSLTLALVVSVDVKHHVYLLQEVSATWLKRWPEKAQLEQWTSSRPCRHSNPVTPLTISHIYYLQAEAKAILGTRPRQTGWSSKHLTWCFRPSQPLWLYQGDTGWSRPRAPRYDLELIRTVDNKLSQSSSSVFHVKENIGAILQTMKETMDTGYINM